LGDGSDQIRFRIRQVSTDGTLAPLSVDRLTVVYSTPEGDELIELNPQFIRSEGETPVVLSIDPDSRRHVHAAIPVSGDTVFIAPFTEGDPANLTGYGDLISDTTGWTSYPSTGVFDVGVLTGVFNGAAKNFRHLRHQTGALDIMFTGGFSSPPVYQVDYDTEIHGSYVEWLCNTGSMGISNPFPGGYRDGTGMNLFISGARESGGWSAGDWRFYSDVMALPDPLTPSRPITYWPSQVYEGADGFGVVMPNFVLDKADDYTVVEFVCHVEKGNLGILLTGNTIKEEALPQNAVIYSSERFGTPQRVRTVLPSATGRVNRLIFFGVRDDATEPISSEDKTDCLFSFGGVRIRGFNNDGITWTGHNTIHHTGDVLVELTGSTNQVVLDAWIRPDGFTRGSGDYTGAPLIWAASTGAEYAALGLDKAGKPYFQMMDTGGTDRQVLGINGVTTDRQHHVLGQYNRRGGLYSGRLEVFLDGEMVGRKNVPADFAAFSTGKHTVIVGSAPVTGAGSFIGSIDDVRIRKTSRNPHQIGVFDSFTEPLKFQTQHQVYTGTYVDLSGALSCSAAWRFDRGTVADDGPRGLHCLIPEQSGQNLWVEREAEGVIGEGISFLDQFGGCYAETPYEADYLYPSGDSFTLMGWVAATDAGIEKEPRIFEYGQTKLSLHQSRYLKFKHYDLNFTGTTNLSEIFGYSWFTITVGELRPGVTGVNCFAATGFTNEAPIQQWSHIMTNLGSETGLQIHLTGDTIYFGHDVQDSSDDGDIYLDEFVVLSGSLPSGQYPSIDTFKHQPDETVLFNESGLATGRVFHLGVYDKQIIAPPRVDFTRTGSLNKIKVSTRAGDVELRELLTYIGTRYVIPDPETEAQLEDLTSKICPTKSPFRIGWQVPSNSVNLSFMTTPELSVNGNLSFIDGSDSNSENFVNAYRDYRLLDSRTGVQATGLATDRDMTRVYFTGQIETDDLWVTNYAMIREKEEFTSPLFFKWNLGQDRLYVSQTGTSENIVSLTHHSGQVITGDSSSFNLLRDNIRLTNGAGKEIPVADFPWDIRVSNLSNDHRRLPHGVFNVDILSRDRFIRNKTIFVEYTAADPIGNYRNIIGHREVLNPEPIYRHVQGSPQYAETYQTVSAFESSETIDSKYNPGPILVVGQLTTGEWSPGLHNGLSNEDDFIFERG